MMHLKIEPRNTPSRLWQILSPLLALILTLITGGILFSSLGKSPIDALQTILISPWLTLYGLTELGVKAAPILLISVGLAICFQAKVWNIGAEGQLTVGAISASAVALTLPNLSLSFNNYSLLILSLLAGIVGGIIWSAIPAILKVRFHAHEILTSLMLNYVAISLLNYLLQGLLKDPNGLNFPESALFSPFATLPRLIVGTRLHFGILLALIAAIIIWGIFKLTFFGFSVKVVGSSQGAANYAGINSHKIIIWSFLLSGGLAGLAGACEVLGAIGQLRSTISPGYGYTAIIAAFIARLNPLGAILSSLLMAILYVGSELLQIQQRIPLAIAGVFQGILFFFLLITELLVNHRVSIHNL
ncbi:ABC transporter permease [Calothrix sp. UHCC 0171]|uniref:ABC transporter permease n=1 Tax=Calothrix sp. UHCC 0171 TaxID=3110245 RepID=UPI002B211F11|nr:ABC transporter permease [Calothrix sp. UHCC 0171]MEA5570424.1 ABC transporter permease [Calothrix sp. UHCC 0171]